MVTVQHKGVNTIRRRRKGKPDAVYYYHRETKKRLPDDPASPEFAAALRRLNERVRAPEKTTAHLIEAFMRSPEFARLSENTRREYRRHLDGVRKTGGDLPADEMTSEDVYEMRDKIAVKHARTADMRVSVLSRLFTWGIKRGYRADNPAKGVDKAQVKPNSYEPWSDAEINTALDKAPAEIADAIWLALYTGQRLGDVLAMTWGDIDGTAVRVRQKKTGERLHVPIHPDLRKHLNDIKERQDNARKHGAKSLNVVEVLSVSDNRKSPILLNSRGTPWTVDGFKTSFRREMDKLNIGRQFHGLRTTAATNLANLGCDPMDIAAVTGHRTAKMVQHYTRRHDQRKRAEGAIARLPSRTKRD